MPVSTAELNEFLVNPRYARYVHTNLHLHTPATPWDWDNRADQTTKAVNITPETYFEALNKTSLELVAITDHNTVGWCEALVSLAKRERKEGRSKIHVLPGVEITTYEGPHLIAIFDESKEVGEISLMINRLGMSGKGEATDKVGAKSGQTMAIDKVLSEVVDNLHGVVIAPHVAEKEGLWGQKEFKGRNTVLNDKRLRIISAPSGEIKRVSENGSRIRLLYKNMDSTLITNSFGCLNVSDCHRLEDLEVNTTWVKMTNPSLEGIRQIIYEPELRVAHRILPGSEKVENPEAFFFEKPKDPAHPRILGVSVTGGMLDGLKASFSAHQNCIIGKNYAGKSAVLDCLRFAMNMVPSDPELHDKFAGRIRAFVGDGGEVKVYLRDASGKVYAISRVFSNSRVGRSDKWQIDGTPDVFMLYGDEFQRESDLSPQQVFPLEIYPQGEVVRIKDNVSQQMKIVDALAKVEGDLHHLTLEDYDGERTLLGRLADNRRSIVSQYDKKEKLSEETMGIQGLEEEIKRLEELSTSSSYAAKKQWAEIEVVIDGYSRTLLQLQTAWSSNDLLPRGTTSGGDESNATCPAAIEKPGAIDLTTAAPASYSDYATGLFEWASKEVASSVDQDRATLREAIAQLTKLEAARKSRQDQAEAEIRRKLEAEDTSTKGDILIDRITEKRKHLNELRGKVSDLEVVKKEITGLERAREGLTKEFEDKWANVRAARRAVVKMIQAACGSSIKAELVENVDKTRYRALLDKIAESLTSAENRIGRRESQLNELAKVPPSQLADMVRKGDATEITRLCPGVTPHTAGLLVGMGRNAMLQLEECRLDDRFDICFKRHGDKEFTRVDSGLSGGEQALALISVAMVPKALPLVIDQPEDELGPALITGELVEQIRHVKTSRQLVFVTHVANIPVLADSEQVMHVEQKVSETAKKSCLSCCGSLDDIEIVKQLLDLDGGALAFQKRSQRYSSVIQAHS